MQKIRKELFTFFIDVALVLGWLIFLDILAVCGVFEYIKEQIPSLLQVVKLNIFSYIVAGALLLIFLIFLLLSIALTTLLERKVMSSIQRRRGPNVAGFFGFLQPFADGLKLLLKELIYPTNANLVLFFLAPIFTFFCSLILWVVIPFDKGIALVNNSAGVLYLLAVSSLAVYGIIFSGWASNSKYAFLGGMRSTAQMIPYEINMTLVFLSVCLLSGSFNISTIVLVQEKSTWFIIPLVFSWVIFLVVALAETNRAPFDLPEAEAESVAGYNVEYSSIAFALFFLGEYANIILMSALGTLFFMGGWLPLFSIAGITLSPFIWFSIKITIHVIFFVWVRATLPRYRYDQLMKLNWKVLMPFNVAFLILIVIIKLFIYYYI